MEEARVRNGRAWSWQEVHTVPESKQENGRVRRGPRPSINQIQADTCAPPTHRPPPTGGKSFCRQ